jgi:hypothetical protein
MSNGQADHVGRYWISIVTSIGSIGVGGLSIYLGYLLFLAGATGTFKFNAAGGGGAVGLESVAPGLAFAFFGASIVSFAVWRLIGRG